jgi:hypothetical protein
MQAVTTIGLDIAKSIFQVHGVDAEGNVVVRRKLKAPAHRCFLPEAAAVSCGDRGLRIIAPLGTRTPGAWAEPRLSRFTQAGICPSSERRISNRN